MKKYIIYAGVNGAGKSTLYASNFVSYLPRVNTDEILQSIHGDWRSVEDVIKAGKIAVNLMRNYLEKGISFNQETTLCGKSILNSINYAKQNNYSIILHYVGVSSPSIAKERVKKRILLGGHGVSDELIEKRYYESLYNLKEILYFCDEVYIYDNSVSFRLICDYHNKQFKYYTTDIPTWLQEINLPTTNNKSEQ